MFNIFFIDSKKWKNSMRFEPTSRIQFFIFTQKMSLIFPKIDSTLQSNEQLYQTGREGVPGCGAVLRGATGGAGGATRIRWICFSNCWCMSSMKSCSFVGSAVPSPAALFMPLPAPPPLPFCWWLLLINRLLFARWLLLLLSSLASSSSDANELMSEFEGDGDWGDRFSCSCSIVRNSWIDSFRAHSWDNSDKSNCRRPYCEWELKKKNYYIKVYFSSRIWTPDQSKVQFAWSINLISQRFIRKARTTKTSKFIIFQGLLI